MREHGIAAKARRKLRCTTDSNHGRPVAENVLNRRFDPAAVNSAWTADITYVATAEGWLYLAAVEDLHSRRIVGWSMGPRIDSRLVVDALEMAVARRLAGEGSTAHSDRGSQYASEHDQGLLARHGIARSMSRRANCRDNAPMESFFASLKKELTRGEVFGTRAEARTESFEYIEVFYNRQRRHSSLGCLSPAEYERARGTLSPAPAIRGEVQHAMSRVDRTPGEAEPKDCPRGTVSCLTARRPPGTIAAPRWG
jgi:transposase InsO family protein